MLLLNLISLLRHVKMGLFHGCQPTLTKLRHWDLNLLPGWCQGWSHPHWVAYPWTQGCQKVFPCYAMNTLTHTLKRTWGLTLMLLLKSRVSCKASITIIFSIHILDLDRPVGEYLDLVGADGVYWWLIFSLLVLIFWLDYEHVEMSLSSLAEEISNPEKGQRLNALSIPSNHLVGEANDIWR